MSGPQRWAEKYMRIPFVNMGFDFRGCHCWGLVWLVYSEERGIVLPKYDMINADQIMATHDAIHDAQRFGPWMRVDVPEPFDVEIMLGARFDEKGRIKGSIERHIGVYAGSQHILHIEKPHNAICVHVKEQFVRTRLRGTYRYTQ
jgi:cell wall-associated NlpC family hydrolase